MRLISEQLLGNLHIAREHSTLLGCPGPSLRDLLSEADDRRRPSVDVPMFLEDAEQTL